MSEHLPIPKAVNYALINPIEEPEPYEILREVRQYHSDIAEAEIGLAWRTNWTSNADGQLILGKCVKASDLQREFMEYDFVIVLNYEVWTNSEWTREKKLALMDHELCHAAVSFDVDGEPKYTERGRPVYRIRKHDIEEFREIIQRHGCFKKDLQEFARTIAESEQMSLDLDEKEKSEAAA